MISFRLPPALSLAAAGLVLAAGSLGLAQKPQEQVFKDKSGRLRLWNMDSHEIRLQNRGPLKFTGSGRPVKGKSEQQGLELSATTIEADLEPGQGGAYLLQRAELSGSVDLAQAAGEVRRTLKSSTALVQDSSEQAVITLASPFAFTQSGGPEAQNASLNARRGALQLTPLRRPGAELKSGEAFGSVVLSLSRGGAKPGRAVLETSSLRFVSRSDALRATLESAFTLEGSSSPAAGVSQVLAASGASGTAAFLPLGTSSSSPLLALTISGSAKVKVTEKRPPTGDRKAETIVIAASAESLTYSRAERRLVLSGTVDYSVESTEEGGEALGGSGQSDSLTIIFDEEGRVTDYRARSGTATIKQIKP